MNHTQGLARIWLALSLSWIFGVLCYHFDDIRNPKIEPHVYLYNPRNKSYLDISGESELFRKLNKDKNYETYDTVYREHYVYALSERKNAIDVMVATTLNDDATVRKAQFDNARTTVIWNSILYAIVPVLTALAIGFAFKWVLAGFRRRAAPKRLW